MSANRLLLLRAVTTRLRQIPGAVIAMEPLRKRFGQRRSTLVVNDFDGDLKFELDLDGHMGSQIFWYGSYSRHELRLLDRIVKPGMTVMDVGANAGEVTLFVAKRVGPTGRVFSFEPLDVMADRLTLNVAMNHLDQVEVVRMGLSDADGEVPIYSAAEAFHDGTHHEGLGTIYPGGPRTKELQRIQLTTADKWAASRDLDRVDVMKIDVEGAELPVIHGALGLVETHRPWLFLEVQELTASNASYTAGDVLDALTPFGYRFYRIQRDPMPEVTRDTLQAFQNVVAVPAGKAL